MKKSTVIYIAVIAISILAASLMLRPILRTLAWPSMVITDGSQDQGLSFRITHVSNTGATVEYIQRGGDITGQLVISYFGIYHQKDLQYVLEVNKTEQVLDLPIPHDERGSFDIDWSLAYDPLKPGDYYLGLSVDDITNDKADPLFDHETYYIPFTIP